MSPNYLKGCYKWCCVSFFLPIPVDWGDDSASCKVVVTSKHNHGDKNNNRRLIQIYLFQTINIKRIFSHLSKVEVEIWQPPSWGERRCWKTLQPWRGWQMHHAQQAVLRVGSSLASSSCRRSESFAYWSMVAVSRLSGRLRRKILRVQRVHW